MFTAPIRVDAGAEGDVRAVVVGDDALGAVAQELGRRGRILLRVPVGVPLQRDALKSIGRVAGGPPAVRA